MCISLSTYPNVQVYVSRHGHLDRPDLGLGLQYCIRILYFQFVPIVHIWVIDEHIHGYRRQSSSRTDATPPYPVHWWNPITIYDRDKSVSSLCVLIAPARSHVCELPPLSHSPFFSVITLTMLLFAPLITLIVDASVLHVSDSLVI